MNKVLSIIIPTYNMEKFLRKCLDSLIVSDEDMEKLEVLVINDGSKDSSSEIAHEYESKYPHTFRVIDKENGNYGSCVNRGLKEAKGKYIKVLDADDSFNKDVFISFISFLEGLDVDLIISDFIIVDEQGATLKEIRFSLPLNKTFQLSQLSYQDSIWMWHHSITYKSDIFNKFDYKQTEGISYSDEEWVFKPMAIVNNAFYFDDFLYLYLRGREGQTYDPIVLRKARKQMDIIVDSLTTFYDKYRYKIYDSGAAVFMYNRIVMLLSNMYRYYFFSHRTEEGLLVISKFDDCLKSKCHFLYEEMGKYIFKSRLRFNYIQRWRKSNHNDYAFVFVIYRLLYKGVEMLKNTQNKL